MHLVGNISCDWLFLNKHLIAFFICHFLFRDKVLLFYRACRPATIFWWKPLTEVLLKDFIVFCGIDIGAALNNHHL